MEALALGMEQSRWRRSQSRDYLGRLDKRLDVRNARAEGYEDNSNVSNFKTRWMTAVDIHYLYDHITRGRFIG